MNTKDYFKDIYSDFFGIENNNEEGTTGSAFSHSNSDDKNSVMKELFDKINSLNISIESQELLKKIITYMRKYNEKIESNYVPFNITLEIQNSKVKEDITDILVKASDIFSYVDSRKIGNFSLYNLDEIKDLSSYGLIVIDKLNGINLEEDKVKKKFFIEFSDFLKLGNRVITIVSGTKEEVSFFFLGNEIIKNKYFNFNIEGVNPDIQSVYNYVIENTKVDDDMKVKVLDYISSTYDVKESDYIEYQDSLIKYISFNGDVPKLDRNKSIDEVFEELNELVGLSKVKRVLHELVDVINLREKAGDSLKIKDLNLHMVFLGNPGTGKTTIARLVANILYDLGYIKENKLIEVSSKDLVGQYVGQTAPKTMSVIEKSMNGVLFIDEAYSLAVKGENSYNAEAIATLIQAMENYRDKLVVIFAGYTKEMQDFLNSNSGIVSRIGYTLEFDDYTTDELIEIFLGMMKKSGFEVEEAAVDYLKDIINKYRNMDNFGNARFVRNIYEKTIVKHASNTKDKKRRDILRKITKEDISTDSLILE